MFTVTNYTGFSFLGNSTRTATPPPTPSLISNGGWGDFSNPLNWSTSGTSLTGLKSGTKTMTASPGCVTISTNAQNGLAAGSFAAGTGFMQTTLTLNGAGSVIGVGRGSTDTTLRRSFYMINSSQALSAAVRWSSGTGTSVFLWGQPIDGINVITPEPPGAPAWTMYALVVSSNTQTARLNGGQLSGTGAYAVTCSATFLDIGGNSAFPIQNPWGGMVGEVRVFSAALGTDDLYKEEGYLAWKWGLQGSLPGTHPYKAAPP